MDNNKDYIELVEQARCGNRESLDTLAQWVRGRLYAYVYRIVLREDISQDIVQESMLEMFNNFDKLERADRFWPWLCKIAFYKTRHYYITEHHHKTVSISDAGDWPQDELKDTHTGLTTLIGNELKQIVFDAMRELKPQHRAILAMRCYEGMRYSQIAELMGSSELRTRVLFYRAKAALHKYFSRKGFGKGFLLSGLALFGRMTAPAETTVPSVTAAATKVGVTATVVGAATSKTTVVTLATAAVLTAGAVLTPLPLDKAIMWTNKTADIVRQEVKNFNVTANITTGHDESWYYYPDKTNGPVITHFIKEQSQTKQPSGQWFEDDYANYYLNEQTNTLHINNHRMWRDNLTVTKLPTDSPNLTKFLSTIEGKDKSEKIDYVSSEQEGLLVITEPCENSYITHNYNALDEEYFRYNWPTAARIVDHRDAMHKRGWTYFRVTGHINGKEISGTGRIPFVYAAYTYSHPWLRLNAAHLEITDGPAGASIYNTDKHTFTTYPSDVFFKGLARPWMGLHTIDTIRRDAAEQQIPFETKYTPGNPKTEVILTLSQDKKIVYTVDMEKDIIEKITLLSSVNNRWETEAELTFSYLDDITQAGVDFAEPVNKEHRKSPQQELKGVWLMRLAEGDLN